MENETSQHLKVIVFQLQDEEYAVPVEQVGSIERVQNITRVPRTEAFVKGVINLRGVVTPIIDLRSRFDLPAAEYTNATRIIIVSIGETNVGLIVDSANDVIDIPESSIEPPPEIVGDLEVEYLQGVAKLEKRLLILLNLHNVLTKEEVDELQAIEG
ncbi:chemotaxis protein CheW [Thalassobacillus sp. CUG 92003]|uniref:chemotaxis protein CheW n=1 Tax=Thalassobacillus sp. CUG 92003 TaxID=2736641 RepID=UPI0015E67180|nr:chemotaxis protein CheW [Thalassobacillus sp. CUG 92003]